jgi:hypothetical protein
LAQSVAELVADLTGRLRPIEDYAANVSPAQQTNLTIICHDDDPNSIEFHTENCFVIVRPRETKDSSAPAPGSFRFRVSDPEGTEREITVGISNQLLADTALRTGGRIETASQFWICCAERRLANHLMERDAFPPANEMRIDTLDREDLLLAIRWGKSD